MPTMLTKPPGFEECLAVTLVYEGGYSNHPKDPGGVTLEGIIQRVYDSYRKAKGLPLQALTKAMRGTPEWIKERNEIYRMQYWDRVHGDELPPGVALVVFDGGVNSGPAQSIKWLQRALYPYYKGAVDGVFGVGTKAAIDEHPDHDKLVADICARRLAFLKQLGTWSTFKGGWSARVDNVKQKGQAWATGSVGPEPVWVDGMQAKAPVALLSDAPVSVGQTTTVGTGSTVLAGVTDQMQQATSALMPFQDAISVVKYILIGITLVSFGLALYGIYRSSKVAKAREGELVEAT